MELRRLDAAIMVTATFEQAKVIKVAAWVRGTDETTESSQGKDQDRWTWSSRTSEQPQPVHEGKTTFEFSVVL